MGCGSEHSFAFNSLYCLCRVSRVLRVYTEVAISIPLSLAWAAADKHGKTLCYLSFHKARLDQGQSIERERGRQGEGEGVGEGEEERGREREREICKRGGNK